MTYAPASLRTVPPTESRTMVGLSLTLLVMGVVSIGCMALVTAQAHAMGGTGEGEGDVGLVELYLSDLFQSAFLCLGLVLLAGALVAFVVGRRYRRG